MALTTLVVGCATPEPLSRAAREELSSAIVDVIRLPAEGLVFTQTAKTIASGVLSPGPIGHEVGRSVAHAEGVRTSEALALVDPAVAIADALASALRSELGVPQARAVGDPSSPRERAPFALYVQTHHWQLVYFVTNWNRYRMYYYATAWLQRTSDSRKLWQGGCNYREGDPETSPTLDELEANGGERLHAMLAEVVRVCAGELRAALVAAPAAR